MDPIADMLIQIKNAAHAKKKSVIVPYSDMKFRIASSLLKAKFLEDVQRRTKKVGKKSFKNLELTLTYMNGDAKLHNVQRISKLSRRIFKKKNELHSVKNGVGISIVTTSKGVMTGNEARHAGVGGEVIAEVW